jgi:hypothetical protein
MKKNPTQSKNVYSLLLWLCVQCGYAVDRPDADQNAIRTKKNEDNKCGSTDGVSQSKNVKIEMEITITIQSPYQQQRIQFGAPLDPQFPAQPPYAVPQGLFQPIPPQQHGPLPRVTQSKDGQFHVDITIPDQGQFYAPVTPSQSISQNTIEEQPEKFS